MKNSFDQYVSKKISNNLSLKKDLEHAKQAVSIAQQLYDLRKSKGLTQVQFAKLIGVSQPNVARLESGDYKSYSLKTLNKAAVALGSNLEIRITPPKETQTFGQVWNIPLLRTFSEKKVIKNTDTKDSSISKEIKESSFYNYAIC